MNFKSASDLKKENSEQKTIYFWGLNNYLQCGDNSKEEQVYSFIIIFISIFFIKFGTQGNQSIE